MAQKKDYSVVTIITNLTKKQAADIQAGIQKVKLTIAPNSRGTGAIGPMEAIGNLFIKGMNMIGTKTK